MNGESHQLQPGTSKKIEVSEGEVTVDWPEGGDGEQKVRIETSFWSRPFQRPVFVLNPDQVGIVEWDETVYSNTPVDPKNPQTFSTGKLLHEFKGVDYEFEPFPREIQAKAGSQITKTRVGLLPVAGSEDRIFKAMGSLPPDQVPAYLKRVLQLDPNDSFALTVLTSTLPPADAIAFLRPGLAARPIRVEWHRTYQHLSDIAEPTKDLKPEYQKLVEETKRAPDAVYLLARLGEGPETDKLYEEAATGKPPSAAACAGLSFRSLSRGDFDKAVVWGTKAYELNPTDSVSRHRYVNSLLAAGKYAELLKTTEGRNAAESMQYFQARLTAFVGTGELGAAEGEIARMVNPHGGQLTPAATQAVAQMRLGLDRMLATAQRDRAKYLEISGRMTGKDLFTENILRGDPKAAAASVEPAVPLPISSARNWEMEATRAGLLYLGAFKAKDAALADQQWKRFTDALGRGDRDGRLYAAMATGKQPFDLARAKDAVVVPSLKRVALAALARKFPEHAKELEPLAKKLDFERDEVSLCLRYVTE